MKESLNDIIHEINGKSMVLDSDIADLFNINIMKIRRYSKWFRKRFKDGDIMLTVFDGDKHIAFTYRGLITLSNVLRHKLDSNKLKNLINALKYKSEIEVYKDLIKNAKDEIVITDNYVDKNIFNILKNTDKKVTLVANSYNSDDYSTYRKENNNVKLIINDTHHDKTITIDRKRINLKSI